MKWEYDLPVGLCKCKNTPEFVYSYHFVCSYPVPKPWSDPRATLYSDDNAECLIELYTLWYKLLAKSFNTRPLHEPIEYLSISEDLLPPVNQVLWH